MSDAAQERAERGAANAPFSFEQCRRIVILARRTFGRLSEKGAIPAGCGFDAWRHDQVMAAVSRSGLRACLNQDFQPLKAHFLELLGCEPAAEAARFRAATDPRRQALAALEREMGDAADVIERPREYVAAIARCRFKGQPLEELTARQVWGLVFDIRRNAQRRRAKGAA